MASKRVILLLGAGSNIGQSVANKFEAAGYRVAVAARRQQDKQISSDRWSYNADLSRPESVAGVFDKVSRDVGVPSVVIYNAASLVPSVDHPFSVSLEDFQKSLSVNTTSTFAAAKLAVEGFAKLPTSTPKAFIFTGNALNGAVMPMLLTLGVGKAASSHIVQAAATAYADKGYQFYYADERNEDGSPVGGAVDGPAHADYYLTLAEGKEQGPWRSTFVKGKGYVQFN